MQTPTNIRINTSGSFADLYNTFNLEIILFLKKKKAYNTKLNDAP